MTTVRCGDLAVLTYWVDMRRRLTIVHVVASPMVNHIAAQGEGKYFCCSVACQDK